MKLFFLTFCIISLINNSYSQQLITSLDSLQKYTYPLFIYERFDSINLIIKKPEYKYRGIGTCFFIRQENKLFLITAYHNITQKGPLNEHYSGGALRIRIATDYDKISTFKDLVIDTIFHNAYSINFFKCPDIFIYEIINPTEFPVNSIESFISKQKKLASLTKVISYGFGNPHDDMFHSEPRIVNLYKESSVPYFGRLKKDLKNIPITDSVYYDNTGRRVKRNSMFGIDSLHYLSNPRFAHGASGSPIFFYKKLHNLYKIWFAGLINIIEYPNDLTIFVKEKYVKKEVDQIISSDIHYTLPKNCSVQ